MRFNVQENSGKSDGLCPEESRRAEPFEPMRTPSPVAATSILKLVNIRFSYRGGDPILRDVTLTVTSQERVGIIGPSGCGKSTLAKVITGFEMPQEGQVLVDGQVLPRRGFRPVQLIYQHPELAVNPHWQLGKTLAEAGDFPQKMLNKMGIDPAWLSRWPNELSGGELQRFCVARALGAQTRFVVADEITTMLDVITQAQLWEFLLDVCNRHNKGLIIITHDHNLARRICTRISHFDDLSSATDITGRNATAHTPLHELRE
ncbi:MAG: ATP-binding cassette domain-containing protein [Coriobacteriales bacterium]|jgi:peptide/nickel transport system ATP-binding protein|nr:ATP-binding cassette domain-containing protein [Coriobacteriales bacterium]